MTDPDRVALLVKGQLLRRYPNSAVYAWKRRKNVAADQSKLLKNAQGQPPNPKTDIQTPVFAGFIAPDITFFGFDIDRDDVADWCFVLEEAMSEPRFGFDVDEPAPADDGEDAGPVRIGAKRRVGLATALTQYAQPGAARTALQARGWSPYRALSWQHMGVAAGAYSRITQLVTPSNAPFADFPSLSPTPTAAAIAKALIQTPFRAYWEGPDLST